MQKFVHPSCQTLDASNTMSRNVEIKAKTERTEALVAKAAALATEGPFEIEQDDTFFACQAGRRKLRAFSKISGELIFYRRANRCGLKESFDVRSPTSEPESLRESLTLAYGQVARVKKHRILFLVGRTRVHLDQVESLGHFLELEVVLAEGEASEVGVLEANELKRKLGIQQHELREKAYVDLLAQRGV
jgi:predicted adenylyl cyclase CyaB